MTKSLESRLYRRGWVFFIIVTGMIAIKRIVFPDFDVVKEMIPCVVYTLTGFYCPGCGGTRSVVALLHGHFIKSLVDFPMVVYCAAVYGWFMISHTVEILIRHRIAIGMKYRHGWIYVSLVILIVHWIVKNIFYIYTGMAPFL